MTKPTPSQVIAESYRVTCSCGKTCVVAWSSADGDYAAQDDGWAFGPNYWTCGMPGHWQKGFVVLSEPDQ